MTRAALLAIAVLLLAAAASASAAACPRTSVADLEDEVMCPVCGTSLGLAREAAQARRERAFIARLVAACHSKEEVKAALVREFGPSVLALPSSRGFGATAYVLPIAGGGLAVAAVLLMLVRWRRHPSLPTGRPAPATPDDRRLDAELEGFR
jgi:cytochrome c-type biogenesis protein CcmH